ncbi:MAG: TPR end-of-group domain-containing protein, partial [Bradymonadia bacterium]
QLVEQRLITDNRFLSAGSASYLGWLRTQGRHQEVVDELMKMKDDGELITLRNKCNQCGFEALLNNALDSFLDSQVERHIEQAIELLDAIEPFMLPLAYDDAPYNLACVAARTGQVERAIKFIETGVKNGVCIRTMSKDKDLQNVWTHPNFIQLLEKAS